MPLIILEGVLHKEIYIRFRFVEVSCRYGSEKCWYRIWGVGFQRAVSIMNEIFGKSNVWLFFWYNTSQ